MGFPAKSVEDALGSEYKPVVACRRHVHLWIPGLEHGALFSHQLHDLSPSSGVQDSLYPKTHYLNHPRGVQWRFISSVGYSSQGTHWMVLIII